jgi:hypothetical protein
VLGGIVACFIPNTGLELKNTQSSDLKTVVVAKIKHYAELEF